MYESTEEWRAVDAYFAEQLVAQDHPLVAARETAEMEELPPHEVAPNQGKLLALLAQMTGARRVLEFGTLAGYSTIWLARAVGEHGHVTTFELEDDWAALAARNIHRAGLSDRVKVVHGEAIDGARALIEEGATPFDLVFIDADKPSNPAYLEATMQLVRPGSVIVADNVVRDGAVIDAGSADARVQGVRRFIELVAADPRLDATALQTVGSKGWDGFVLARVVSV